MKFLIISGMSGAGKSKAVSSLEDLGFYCVDNMPPELIPKFTQICMNAEYEKVALVMDIRTSRDFDKLFLAIDDAKSLGCEFKILFLDSKNETLVTRYKETRRKHPMSQEGKSLLQSIMKEREMLEPIRMQADFKVDTSALSTSRLRDHMLELFFDENDRTLMVNVMTFGFKHGSPNEADLLFDVRFLPNPYYDKQLRPRNGTDEQVSKFVFENGVAEQFLDKLRDMIDFLIPKYIDEGKTSLVIAIGCTGGKHRSVAIGEQVLAHVLKNGYSSAIVHRDIGKV